jgi:hypothetical protein
MDESRLLVTAGGDPPSPATAGRIVDSLLEAGFESPGDGGRIEYDVTEEAETGSVSQFVDELEASDDDGSVTLSFDGHEATIFFQDGDGDSPIALSGFKETFGRADVPLKTVETLAELLVSGVETIVAELEPWGVVACLWSHPDELKMVDEPLSELTFSKLGWLTVFGPEWCDHLGGAERLLKTPAWRTRRLANGSVLVRVSELPDPEWSHHSSHSLKPTVTPADYVFQEWPAADAERLREHARATADRDHLDPFRSFEDGAWGHDIVICKYHAPLDIEETDYSALIEEPLRVQDRCKVLAVKRDGDVLRTESGTFARRLVDDDGTPIGERPTDVPPEHELLTLTIGADEQRKNPTSWYHTEEPRGKSTFRRLYNPLVERSLRWRDDE